MSATSGGADQRRRILSVVAAACPPHEEQVAGVVEQVRDDLDAGRIDVTGALTLVASLAWRQGHDAAGERSAPVETDPRPQPFHHRHRLLGADPDDYIVLITDPDTGEVDAQGPFPSAAAKAVADQARIDLSSTGLRDFTVTITRLLPFRLKTT